MPFRKGLAGPSSNAEYIYKSIARLDNEVKSGQGITLTPAQGLDLVLNLDRFITESAEYINTANSEFVASRETLKRWKTYHRYGDLLWKDL